MELGIIAELNYPVVMGELEQRIERLAEWMAEANRLVVFTGAGISTDSGLPDFRGPDGVWTRRDKGLPPHERRDWSESEPNAAHIAIHDLQEMGRLAFLISQNIDNLHIKSGIRPELLAELHGNVARLRCTRCEETWPRSDARESCACGGALKPSVVGFGDSLPMRDLEASFLHAQNCDLFVVVGSSLVVAPAATVPQVAARMGARLVIINRGETPLDRLADLRFEEGIAEVFPRAVQKMREHLQANG